MTTPFENSWTALMTPGKATDYFSVEYLPQLEITSEYNQTNAWWLAECSRLIYRQEKDELNESAYPPTRRDILQRVGWKEIHFFNNKGAQCGIFSPHDNRCAILVFRGTHEFKDWLFNLNALPMAWPKGGMVHRGFKEAFDDLWQTIEIYLTQLYVPLFYTGHSLGAALALLATSEKPDLATYTFGSPRVGNIEFANTLKNAKIYRIVNNRDIVPTFPPDEGVFDFCHNGELHYITSDGQLVINPTEDFVLQDKQKETIESSVDYRRWFDPQAFLADHAPINYVAHLEKLLSK